MNGLWESKCDRCGLPLADHVYNDGDDGESEWIEPLWTCPALT